MPKLPRDELRCTATTKAGERCPVARQRGRDTCLAHSGDAKSHGFSVGGGRTPAPKERERLAALVDERIERILGAYFDALEAERTLWNDDAPIAVPDHETRMKAADRILNRHMGTPKASVEVEHSGGMTLDALFVRDPLQPTHTPLPEDDA